MNGTATWREGRPRSQLTPDLTRTNRGCRDQQVGVAVSAALCVLWPLNKKLRPTFSSSFPIASLLTSPFPEIIVEQLFHFIPKLPVSLSTGTFIFLAK
jgi:hypothetical protein